MVKGAAHGVPGQAGAIEQHTGGLIKVFLNMIKFLVHVTDLTTCSACPGVPAHHLPEVHLSEAASLSLSRRFKRRV